MRIRHPHANPKKKRRAEWDDYDMDHPLVLDGITVYEVEEELMVVSPILGPDGQPIIHEFESEKLGFIGFIDPATFETEEEDDEGEEVEEEDE